MQPGLLKKARVDPAVAFRKSLPLSIGSGGGSLVLQQCFPGRPGEAGRFPAQDPPRGPDTVTPSSGAQSSGPRARRLGIYQEQRHGGAWRRRAELQSHLVSQSAPGSLRSERPSPSSWPAGRRVLARGFCTWTGPDRPGTDGRSGLGLRSLLWSKSRHRKIAQDGPRRQRRKQQRCRGRGGRQKASVRAGASRTPHRAQSRSQGSARAWPGREREIFGFTENGVWESKRKPRRKEEGQPRLKTGSCCLTERQGQEGEAVTEAGAPLPRGAHTERSCAQHFGLKET